jgi:hypothetical protein
MSVSLYHLISSLYFSSYFFKEALVSINSIKLEGEKQPTLGSFAQFSSIKLTYLKYLFVTHISSNLLLFQPRKNIFTFNVLI